jgi:hypothetical protein
VRIGFALRYPFIHGMEALQALAARRVAEPAERAAEGRETEKP